MHYFATCMVALGAHFSAIWIIVANSWMQTPAGYHIVGEGMDARAEIIDFWAMVFNPSSMDRLVHSVIGAWLSGAFLVISVAAFYMLRGRHLAFANASMKVALGIALVAVPLQAISGDSSGQVVAKHQPMKLAAMEGLFHTEKHVQLTLFGIPNVARESIDYQLAIPGMLSYLSFRDFNAEIKGLDQVPKSDWPKVGVVFSVFRLMLAMWGAMLLCTLLGAYYWFKGRLDQNVWVLRLMTVSVLFPQIGNQAGWMVAEMGRYPWIVYGHLRISEGLSKSVTANQILGSIIMFGIVYFFLFILFVYILNEKISHGPEDIVDSPIYPRHEEYTRHS